MSSQPLAPPISNTAPGPPIPLRETSLSAMHNSNPFQVDLVIPFSISIEGKDKAAGSRDVREGYERLLNALEGVGGLRIASRVPKGPKGKEEVWVFVGISEEKLEELQEIERYVSPSSSLLLACLCFLCVLLVPELM